LNKKYFSGLFGAQSRVCRKIERQIADGKAFSRRQANATAPINIFFSDIYVLPTHICGKFLSDTPLNINIMILLGAGKINKNIKR